MRTTWWQSGQYNAICDVCGFKFKNVDLQRRWDGLIVCHEDWEIQHPQERIRPIPDQKKPLITRPEATNSFVNVDYVILQPCSVTGVYSQADYGTADCAIVGNVNQGYIL